MNGDAWTLRFEGLDPAQEGLREALCAVGNGWFVTRAAAPESVADGVHHPGTYLAGVYHRTVSTVQGRTVANEDLVNCPNWLPFTFRAFDDDGPADTPWFGEPGFCALDQRLEFDLRHAVLTRRRRCRDSRGRTTDLVQRVFAHMGQPHLGVLVTHLTPVDWSGTVEIRSGLEGRVVNDGVARYRGLQNRHLVPTGQDAAGELVRLQVATPDTGLRIGLAARTRLRAGDRELPAPLVARSDTPGRVDQVLTVAVRQGHSLSVEKTVALFTSRDRLTAEPATAAVDLLAVAGDATALEKEHRLRWAELWRRCRIGTDFEGAGTIHLYLLHLLQTYSQHSVDLDVGIPARGLHGEAYRGHVFWDELFILPWFNRHLPELSRSVLRYRHHRLDQARRAAADTGRRGGMFPWQSGSDGAEETQELHLNPRSGRWLPDHSRLQHHVGSAVAYNVWQYHQATGDTEFLAEAGAELVLEIARFWADSAVFDEGIGRYRIRGVVGPDEYHDAYPWSPSPGIDDNAYTNVMASWTLHTARRLLPQLPGHRRAELLERLGIDAAEPARWSDVEHRLHVPLHDGVISQFDGYERLEELDWAGLRRRHPDIRRLDRILEAEGDTVNRYRASKQADVLMLWYLFPPAEVHRLLSRLGVPVDAELMERTVDYYLARTSHGSTLSAVVHAWVLARRDRTASWRFFQEAVASDVHDIQGGTTAEGVHLGAMAGAVDLLERCYSGLSLREETLVLDPALPPQLGQLDLTLHHRGHDGIAVRLTHQHASVTMPRGTAAPIRVVVHGAEATLRAGETFRVDLRPAR
ncbi:glycoside hydrolase family 65 protein [Streptacidiphilus jiangxiensis]|uniref:Trehalose and maltose hydrolase (Possible phosphorylase) n=1 Tax=Streptacidiphilus jiangxiensis TaxID=235985 RepID=A0A1H7QWF7_STRJI|nr:glycosyl hydrolase family 65 protein [Streptacidiphilus jiangxiensis]SEL51647.1 Trehalose and maltose hydrolase (possible phosphorylase) [Streptacidiphilus jiangxiensis]